MANAFTTEAFTLLGVGVVIISLRWAARVTSVGLKGLQADDYLMLLAAVVYALETAAAYIVGAWWFGLANNGMTDEQRAKDSPDSPEHRLRIGGSKTQLVGWSLYTLLLWLLKLCMTIFYSRLTAGLNHLQIRVRIAYVFVAVTYIATISSILLGCRPLHKNWQIYPNPGNHCQPAISKIDLYVTVVLNVITDMYLLSIPLPMLWKANMPKRRKYSLLVIFSGGIFVMMAGILRCALILMDPVNGAQQAGSWAVRETFVAVVIGNVPMIYPLFRRGMERAAASSLFSRYKNTGSDDSYEMQSNEKTPPPPRKRRSLYALPSTVQDASNSTEHIVLPVPDQEKKGGITVTTEAAVETTPSTLESGTYNNYSCEKPVGEGYRAHIFGESRSGGDA